MDILYKYKLIFINTKTTTLNNQIKQSNVIFAYIKYLPAMNDEEEYRKNIHNATCLLFIPSSLLLECGLKTKIVRRI